MSFERALAIKIHDIQPELLVYPSRVRNGRDREPRYPSGVLKLISQVTNPLGAGSPLIVRDSHGLATATGRNVEVDEVYRLTVLAPDTNMEPGMWVVTRLVQSLCDGLESLFMTPPISISDTQASPTETFLLRYMSIIGQSEVPEDTSGEPFLYGRAVSIACGYLTRTTISSSRFNTISITTEVS